MSMSASGCSDFILSPALRIRSLPISHIFLYPALFAVPFSSANSGSCVKINLQAVFFSKLNSISACAIVPEPEKKSSTNDFSPKFANVNNLFINLTGLGPSKTPAFINAVTSFAPSWLCPTSLYAIIDIGAIPSYLSSVKKRFIHGTLFPSAPK